MTKFKKLSVKNDIQYCSVNNLEKHSYYAIFLLHPLTYHVEGI